MALRFVDIKDFSCLNSKGRIDLEEAVGDVFMYRTLTYSKLLRCLPHCCICCDDIICDFNRALFDIILQKKPLKDTVFTMYARGLFFIPLYYFNNSSNRFLRSSSLHFFQIYLCKNLSDSEAHYRFLLLYFLFLLQKLLLKLLLPA